MSEPTYGTAPTTEAPAQAAAQSAPGTVQVNPTSILDEALADINAAAEPNIQYYEEPGENWLIGFDCDIDSYKFKAFQKAARGGNRAAQRAGNDEVDQFRLCTQVIREQSVSIAYKGQELPGDDGEPMTLNSPSFLNWMQKSTGGEDIKTPTEAVEHFLKAPKVLSIGNKVITDAGYGDEVNTTNS